MDKNTQSLLSGWPETREETSETGERQIIVKIDALRPVSARIADWISVGLAIMAVPVSIYGAVIMPDPNFVRVIGVLALPIVVYPAARYALHKLLRTSTSAVFSPGQFSSSKLFGERRFDRNMPHKFALYRHEKASREEEVLSFKDRQRRGFFQRPAKRYYGKSYRLSFDYLDQRNDIMLIYGHKTAQLVLSRLNAADQIMDGYAGKSHGQVLAPQEEWSSQPGDLLGEF